MHAKRSALVAVVTISIVTFTVPIRATAQLSDDHLKCFKAKDPQDKSSYTADLGGLIVEDGCQIKVPASMVCVPGDQTNVQPVPTGNGGTGTPNTFGCYKIKCPKLPKGTAPPTVTLADQFGNRSVIAAKSGFLCAPAVPTDLSCIEPFTDDVRLAVDLLTHNLDSSDNLDVPSSCGGDPTVCCPGGTAVSPCGPLHIEPTSAMSVAPSGADQLDLTYRMRVATVTDLPVNILGIDCGVHIDTTQGSIPTIQLTMPVNLSADALHIIALGTPAVNDLEVADVQITGGFTCQLANFGLSFFISTLTSTLDTLFQFDTDLCRRCDSKLVQCSP